MKRTTVRKKVMKSVTKLKIKRAVTRAKRQMRRYKPDRKKK